MALIKKRTKNDFSQIDEVLNITKLLTIPSNPIDSKESTSSIKRALMWNETLGVLRIENNGVWETVNGGNSKTNLRYIYVSENDLVSLDSNGIAIYVNQLPLFYSLPNDYWKVIINETNQIFDISINDTSLGLLGDRQLIASDVFEYGKVSSANLLKNEEFVFLATNTEQIFIISENKTESEIITVLVNGVALSKTQYQFIEPNQIKILDELEIRVEGINEYPDFVNVISGRVVSSIIKKGVFVWGLPNSGVVFGMKSWYKDHTPSHDIDTSDNIICSVQFNGGTNQGENFSVTAEPLANGDIRFRLTSVGLFVALNNTINISISYIIL